jgi:hypothetical protein
VLIFGFEGGEGRSNWEDKVEGERSTNPRENCWNYALEAIIKMLLL